MRLLKARFKTGFKSVLHGMHTVGLAHKMVKTHKTKEMLAEMNQRSHDERPGGSLCSSILQRDRSHLARDMDAVWDSWPLSEHKDCIQSNRDTDSPLCLHYIYIVDIWQTLLKRRRYTHFEHL